MENDAYDVSVKKAREKSAYGMSVKKARDKSAYGVSVKKAREKGAHSVSVKKAGENVSYCVSVEKREVGLSCDERGAHGPVCGGSARDERVGLMCWRVDQRIVTV